MKLILIILEIIIWIFSFIGLYFFKTGSFIPQGEFLTLFGIYILLWLFLSNYYNKYKRGLNFYFIDYFQSLFFTFAFTLFFLVLIISLTDLRTISRLFIINITVVPFLIELSIVTLFWVWLSLEATLKKSRREISDDVKKAFKLQWLVGGFVLFTIAFVLINILKYGSIVYYLWSETILIILLGSWIISVGLTGKYNYYQSQNLYYQIAPFIKSGFIMFIIVTLVYYFFRLESLSRLVLFGTIPIYVTTEIVIFSLIMLGKKNIPIYQANVLNDDSNIFGQKSLSINSQIAVPLDLIDISSLFKRVSIKESSVIVKFLMKHINGDLERNSVTLLSTSSLEDIKVLQNNSQNLLINLHNMNDMRRLNEYLISCHRKTTSGGILVGCFIPLENTRYKLRSKMPKFIFIFVYPFHFLFYRVFPKLPKIRHLYFVLTKGRNRIISKAEIFGRISFCGYKVIAEKMIGNDIYFIAQRLNTVSTESNPSYGPIIKLKRIGFQGEIITIHKFRTMHPYSEFIQSDLYVKQELDITGDKIIDDFRLTSWGQVLRKYWIDELPQLYDWFRGKITIVGVRALSEAKYKLYPDDLQKKRVENKPGLIPPYYVDIPKNFDEFLESERKYLLKKKEKPFLTDFIYFWKVFNNIVFHGARSQ